jgi:hypothetical protein
MYHCIVHLHTRKFLLSNGMDNTLRQWDVRPFVTGSRQVKVFQGATVSGGWGVGGGGG